MRCNRFVLQQRVDPNTPGIRASILETHTQYATLQHETLQLTTCPCHFEMKAQKAKMKGNEGPKGQNERKWRKKPKIKGNEGKRALFSFKKRSAESTLGKKMGVSSETSSQNPTFCENYLHSPALKSPYQQPTGREEQHFAYQEMEEMWWLGLLLPERCLQKCRGHSANVKIFASRGKEWENWRPVRYIYTFNWTSMIYHPDGKHKEIN